jgi:hypothetical protein
MPKYFLFINIVPFAAFAVKNWLEGTIKKNETRTKRQESRLGDEEKKGLGEELKVRSCLWFMVRC